MSADVPKYFELPNGAKYPAIGLGTFTIFTATVSKKYFQVSLIMIIVRKLDYRHILISNSVSGKETGTGFRLTSKRGYGLIRSDVCSL